MAVAVALLSRLISLCVPRHCTEKRGKARAGRQAGEAIRHVIVMPAFFSRLAH